MTARYTHVALDTKVNAVKALPTLGEKPTQSTHFAEVISNLPVTKLPQLAVALEALLSLEQQSKLLKQIK